MSKVENLKFGPKKKYSRQSPTAFGHIKYEGVWTHSAWVRHKDAVTLTMAEGKGCGIIGRWLGLWGRRWASMN